MYFDCWSAWWRRRNNRITCCIIRSISIAIFLVGYRVCVCVYVHARGEWRDVWWAVERELLFVLYALPTLCAMRTISMMMRKWSNCFMFTTVRFVSCVSDIQVNGSRIIFHAVCRLRNKLHTASPSSSLSSLANVKSFFFNEFDKLFGLTRSQSNEHRLKIDTHFPEAVSVAEICSSQISSCRYRIINQLDREIVKTRAVFCEIDVCNLVIGAKFMENCNMQKINVFFSPENWPWKTEPLRYWSNKVFAVGDCYEVSAFNRKNNESELILNKTRNEWTSVKD